LYPFLANLYQKLPISAIFGVVSPHFKSDNGKIWPEGMDLGYPPSRVILKKNRFLAKYTKKIQISAIFFGCKLSENGEIWRECTDPGHPLRP